MFKPGGNQLGRSEPVVITKISIATSDPFSWRFHMRFAKSFALSALLAGIGLVPSFARGQSTGQFSDLTTELLSDGNGNKVPFTPGIFKGGVPDNGVLNEDPNGAVETAAY